ncbi:MAG: hypothetical protein ACM359_09460 [Bacillota bacterium]
MFVQLVQADGEEVSAPLSMERLPLPGERIALRGGHYVVTNVPVTHELKAALRGMSWVATLTVQAETKAGR